MRSKAFSRSAIPRCCPSIYHVYLHPSDYDTIKPVILALTAEARLALIERLDQLNRAAKPSSIARTLGFDSGKHIEYKIVDPDWTIEFHPDAEEQLEPRRHRDLFRARVGGASRFRRRRPDPACDETVSVGRDLFRDSTRFCGCRDEGQRRTWKHRICVHPIRGCGGSAGIFGEQGPNRDRPRRQELLGRFRN